MMRDKFEDAKVGDPVCLVRRGGFSGRVTALKSGKIERVTKTQFTALGSNWMKSSGCRVGETTYSRRSYIEKLTPERLQEFVEDKAIFEAEGKCEKAAKLLASARGEDALKYAAHLDALIDEHKATKP